MAAANDIDPPSASKDMGIGSVALTQKKRKEYGDAAAEFQMNGEQAPSWESWLSEQGMGLDGKGLVVRKK